MTVEPTTAIPLGAAVFAGIVDTVVDGAGMITAVLATTALVSATSLKAWRFIDRMDARFEITDAIGADWKSRGLTSEGGIAEYRALRDSVAVNTSAIAEHSHQISALEGLIERRQHEQ